MEQTIPAREGIILSVNAGGLAIVEADDVSKEQLPFTFDKVVGYRGEQPSEVGIKSGARVRFSTNNRRVIVVEVLKRPTT